MLRPAHAADLTADMHMVTQDGIGESVGTISLSASEAGTKLMVKLHGLPPGPHGFHLHQNAACGPTTVNDIKVAAGAAGGHFDPDHTSKHLGPMGEGHMGDLPLLQVAADGTATETLTAPRLKQADALKGHALVIHAGGDNYSDTPAPLGGGGARIACGTIE